ncbi:MAG: tetratricopeptide repeat protein [Flavobacteriales bacterium]
MSKTIIFNKAIRKGFCALILLISFASDAQNEALFDQGKTLYKAEKYQDAISVWKKIEQNKQQSAALYFNLGNAYYKLNKIAPSIYYFEKALQLAPNDKDIKNNLSFAQNATVDAIEPLPETLFSKWYASVSGMFTYNGWAVVAVVFFIIGVILFLSYFFSYSEVKKRLFFVFSTLSILFFMSSLSMAFMSYNDFKNNHPAIIFSESVAVKSEPNLGSDDVFTLHEGTKVQIKIEEEDWVKIQLVDGKEGWILKTDLKEF